MTCIEFSSDSEHTFEENERIAGISVCVRIHLRSFYGKSSSSVVPLGSVASTIESAG